MKNNDSDGGIGFGIKFKVSIRVPIDIGHIDANGILTKDNRSYYFQDAEVQVQEVENNCWYSIAIKDANDLKNIAKITVEEAACVLGRLEAILQEHIAFDQEWDEESELIISVQEIGETLIRVLYEIPLSEFYKVFSMMKAHEIEEMCQSKNPVAYLDNNI